MCILYIIGVSRWTCYKSMPVPYINRVSFESLMKHYSAKKKNFLSLILLYLNTISCYIYIDYIERFQQSFLRATRWEGILCDDEWDDNRPQSPSQCAPPLRERKRERERPICESTRPYHFQVCLDGWIWRGTNKIY